MRTVADAVQTLDHATVARGVVLRRLLDLADNRQASHTMPDAELYRHDLAHLMVHEYVQRVHFVQ
jgi:hypothetical protein